MKVLLTGANGFLGRNLKQFLLSKGLEIFSLTSSKETDRNNYQILNTQDIDTISRCLEAVRPDYIFHLAGNQIHKDQTNSDLLNYFFFKNIIDSLIKKNINDVSIVAIGSAAEYGIIANDVIPINENLLENPQSPYGVSKLKQTKYAIEHSDIFKNILVARPFNIIGYGLPEYLPLGNFIKKLESAIISTKPQKISMKGINFYRDYIDIHDLTEILWKLANSSKVNGEKFNTCTSTLSNLQEIVIKISNPFEVNLDIQQVNPDSPYFIKNHFGDNQKLMSLFPDLTFKPLQESIEDIQISLYK